MYERFRNDVLCEFHNSDIPRSTLNEVLRILDHAAARYDFREKELALTVYNDDLPEIAKTYLVCKKIEGLEDRTLATYMRTLKIFFREFAKPVEMITANDVRIFLFKYQQERKCANRSLDKYRAYLASFFSWATDEGYLPRNPMRTIQPIKFERKTAEYAAHLIQEMEVI